MDDTEKPRPICHCCGKALYRVEMPGQLLQQLAAMAMDAGLHDLTDFLLATIELMHEGPETAGSRRLPPEEAAELRRELERN